MQKALLQDLSTYQNRQQVLRLNNQGVILRSNVSYMQNQQRDLFHRMQKVPKTVRGENRESPSSTNEWPPSDYYCRLPDKPVAVRFNSSDHTFDYVSVVIIEQMHGCGRSLLKEVQRELLDSQSTIAITARAQPR